MLTHDASADLVHRAQRGEADAFTGLVQAFLRPAYSIALSVVGRPADAEDIAQEAFLKAFQAIDTCREAERFAAWLFQIVRNRARNLLDSRRLRDVAPDGAKILEFATLPSEAAGMREALLSALADLDAERREVVLLHDLEDWTHKEIAEVLDISEVHSRQHLFQARQILRAKLGGGLPLSGAEGNHAG
ncbi:MAG TPA: sigma-70 family RNA polymerase sigma factor [Polyangia bacterium]